VDVSVEMIVSGWIALSYGTPSTMWIVTIAARISHGSLDSELSNTWDQRRLEIAQEHEDHQS
jgi:hypothetical protein